MELTLENLISFLEKKYPYDEGFNTQTKFRDDNRKCTFDGIDAIYLLEDLEREFEVTFESFDFHQYFLEESELNTMTWKHLFKLKKQREIKEELTVQILFDYMNNNNQSSTGLDSPSRTKK